MHETKNDMPQPARVKVIELLQPRLAEAIDLKLQAKQAHWNVKGPNFIALHELFDKVADEAEDWSDEFAERIAQLGGAPEGTLKAVAGRSRLAPYPLDLAEGRAHVNALSSALAAFGAEVRGSIEKAAKLKDADTSDLFTEVSREADKQLWFLEAHLQAEG
jgi:starvation-inducible DNA-binding protein